MQTKLSSRYAVVLIALLSGGIATAQNEMNFNDLNPQDVDIQRTDSVQQPKELPPIQPAGLSNPNPQRSMFENDLRGGGSKSSMSAQNPTGDFAAQPLPPAPRHNFNSGMKTDQPKSQDPLQNLNPSRLPVMQQQPQSQPVRPQFDTQPRSNMAADSIPSTAPSTPRSILTPSNPITNDSTLIVPAGYENGNRMNNTTTGGPIIKKDISSLIASYSIANTEQPIPGVPVSLEEMLRTTEANARMSMVQQYWETYFDWATLQNRQRFEAWLSQVRGSRSQTDQQLLQTARSMAKNEILAAEIQLARSQSRLQEISRTKAGEFLPLPLNDPVTSKYITHYDWYAKRNMVPAKLKGINEMLPRTYQLLSQRAQTVGQAEQAKQMAVSAYTSGQAGMAAVLESGRSWQSSLQSMIATVVSYNKAISDYALTITPPQKPVADIASMLVSKPKEVTANISDQPAAAGISGNSYSAQPSKAGGLNAAGPNAGRFRRPTATQQPGAVQAGNGLSDPARSQSVNDRAAMRNDGFPAQRTPISNTPPSNVSVPSGASGAAAIGSAEQTGIPAAPQNKPQQPTGNNSFQGGGGSFGGQ